MMTEIIIAIVMFLFALLAIRTFFRLITDATLKSLAVAKADIAVLKKELAAEKRQSELIAQSYLKLDANRTEWVTAYEKLKLAKGGGAGNKSTVMSIQTWRRIAKLTHPDKHNNSKESEEVMKILLDMKPK